MKIVATEIEIKYQILSTNTAVIKDKLNKFNKISRKFEKNIMFDNLSGDLDKLDARLRVRLISNEMNSEEKNIELTYKRRLSVEDGIKKEEEIEVAFVTDAKDFIIILNKMGYESTTSYERFRESYKASEVKVTWDKFPYGVVLELEGNEEDILSLEKEMGLSQKDRYALSCDDLYRELCAEKNIPYKLDITFDDPDMPKY